MDGWVWLTTGSDPPGVFNEVDEDDGCNMDVDGLLVAVSHEDDRLLPLLIPTPTMLDKLDSPSSEMVGISFGKIVRCIIGGWRP